MAEKTDLENIKDLLICDIPEFTPPDDGFLEIIGLSHYENINSKIYAYFLNQQKEPEIAEKFLAALFELIQQKKADKIISFDDYEVSTEYATNKGRIDILIEDKNNQSAIIIENKIYHFLDNPLEEYFEYINGKPENKVGILLTLHHLSTQELKNIDGNYINITHKEWVDKIMALGLPANLNPKKYIYLNDFFQTINNLTTEINMNDLAKFYFNHTKKINSALLSLQEAQKFIDNQLEILAQRLNLSVFGKTYVWRNLWDAKNKKETYYTIIFDSLFNGNNKVTVIIELIGEDFKRKEDVAKHLKYNKNITEKELKINTSAGTTSYCHLISKEYKLTNDNIEKFAEKLKEFIEEDFEKVMIEINNFLHPTTILTKK